MGARVVAGLSAGQRDVDAVAAGLPRWWAAKHPDDAEVAISSFESNPTSGFSSDTLLFSLTATRRGRPVVEDLVLRMPPAGGGLFPEYDMVRQARVQDLLADAGIPAPSPARVETDPRWIGTEFLVMPRIDGRIPGDYVYLRKGWLHDSTPAEQHRCHDAFVDVMIDLFTIDVEEHDVSFLARPAGTGLDAELAWWSDFLGWATDGAPPAPLADAYAWLRDRVPDDVDPPSITWGDARFANAIFTPHGAIAGVLDWEQAAVGPAELDVAMWLTSRRQTREVWGVDGDRELPGFPAEADAVARIESGIGRPLRALDWHEVFASVRMGTCLASTQTLLRRAGTLDHPFLSAEPVPGWVIDTIGAA